MNGKLSCIRITTSVVLYWSATHSAASATRYISRRDDGDSSAHTVKTVRISTDISWPALRYSVDSRLRTDAEPEPVPLKYGIKLATKYPWIYGQCLQCSAAQSNYSLAVQVNPERGVVLPPPEPPHRGICDDGIEDDYSSANYRALHRKPRSPESPRSRSHRPR